MGLIRALCSFLGIKRDCEQKRHRIKVFFSVNNEAKLRYDAGVNYGSRADKLSTGCDYQKVMRTMLTTFAAAKVDQQIRITVKDLY
jgi:hypothetical protein